MAKEMTVQYGDYVITIDESGTVKVSLNGSECKNTIAALRDIAEKAGFTIDEKWNTRQTGKKLAEYLNTNTPKSGENGIDVLASLKKKYDNAWAFDNGLYLIMENDLYGFADKNGNTLVQPQYNDTYDDFVGGMIFVWKNGLGGYVNESGEEVIAPQFKRLGYFENGYTFVSQDMNGKWGVFDINGNQITPLIYDDISSFTDGKAKVKLNGEEFYIDTNGNKVVVAQKIKLTFFGHEDEYFAIDSEGDEGYCSYGGISYMSEIYVDDNETGIDADKIAKIVEDQIKEEDLKDDTDGEIVGLRKYENKANFSCEIETEDFDPSKLTLVYTRQKFKINDTDTFAPDEKFFSHIIYDGTKYIPDFDESRGIGSEIVWGVDPEEMEEVELCIGGEEVDFVCNRPCYDAYSALNYIDTITIDDEEYDLEDCKEQDLGRKVVEFGSTSGIMKYYNSAEYKFILKVNEEFDPELLTLNFADLVFKVGDEEIETGERVLWNVSYNGVTYELDDSDNDCGGGELFWGKKDDDDDDNEDCEDDDEYEEEVEDEDNDENGEEDCTDSSDVLASLKKKYHEVLDDGDIYTIRLNGEWGFADRDGNELIAPKYDWLGNYFVDGMIVAGYRGHMGYVNNKGIEAVEPKYDSVMEFSNGYAPVMREYKWGIINKEGVEVIPLLYNSVERFNEEGIAEVTLNGEKFYLDTNGNRIDEEFDKNI